MGLVVQLYSMVELGVSILWGDTLYHVMVLNFLLVYQIDPVQEQPLSAVDARISLCLSGNNDRYPILFSRYTSIRYISR